jgi:hypothetical protein
MLCSSFLDEVHFTRFDAMFFKEPLENYGSAVRPNFLDCRRPIFRA